MKVFQFGNDRSGLILIQMVDIHSIQMIESEADLAVGGVRVMDPSYAGELIPDIDGAQFLPVEYDAANGIN